MASKKSILIESTSNYDKLKFIPGNRPINREHIQVLKASIQKHNLLCYNPIIVNSKMGIIDGQHRFVIAQELKVPIYYIVADDITPQDIILLNNTNRRWKLDDYLETFIHQGLEDYKILKEFSSKFHISISTGLAVLGMTIGKNGKFSAPITKYKIGEFKVIDLAESITFIKNFQDIAVYAEENTEKDRDFLAATFAMYYKKRILPADFMKRMKQYPFPLFRRLGRKDYLRQFEDVYNYGHAKNVRLI